MNDEPVIDFWTWLLKGSGNKPGFRRLWDLWLIVHLLLGVLLSVLLKSDLEMAAKTVLIPLSGIFIGLAFAWAGNAQSLLQSKEIHQLTKYHAGGYVEYLYIYQLAILIILTTLILWGLAALGMFDLQGALLKSAKWYFVTKTILFTLASLTIKVCWNVVLGTQMMLMVQKKIKDNKNQGTQ